MQSVHVHARLARARTSDSTAARVLQLAPCLQQREEGKIFSWWVEEEEEEEEEEEDSCGSQRGISSKVRPV
ncbi:hypothetical protein EYF80_053149 [Liparis tanakae]|uniref:Uncharacterized protein n=1 Tax=Liparis tanakae TaxID=230148 RepID=A0A4Z2F778_9TELE|nr:hypothetical protein EYF80_053149 [Liparis tanakae]